MEDTGDKLGILVGEEYLQAVIVVVVVMKTFLGYVRKLVAPYHDVILPKLGRVEAFI